MHLLKLSLIVVGLASPSALGASLFKDPGQWFKDTGRSIDKSRLKLIDATGDVLTFGHCGRERDKARAAEARAVALERLRAAEKVKQVKVIQLTERLATAKANLIADQHVLGSLKSLADLIQDQKETSQEMIILLIESNAGFEQILKLVGQQQQDLSDFLDSYLANDPNNQGIMDAQKKLNLLKAQIAGFPYEKMNEDEVEKLVFNAMVNIEEVVLALAETIELVNTNMERQNENIVKTDAAILELLKEPSSAQPKKKPKAIPVHPDRPYKDRHGRWTHIP